jgi:hypothetical protein
MLWQLKIGKSLILSDDFLWGDSFLLNSLGYPSGFYAIS